MRLLLGAFLLFFASNVVAEDCTGSFVEQEGKDVLASASLFMNLGGMEGSVRKESEKLLQEASRLLQTITPPPAGCPTGCKPQPVAELVFLSQPNKLDSSADDTEYCRQLLKRTEQQPITFNQLSFPDMPTFSSWFSQLAQGKGTEGSVLYAKCDRDCSPIYRSYIDNGGKNISAVTEVVCGEPRDKDDNQYVLSYKYRWRCESN